MLLVKHRLKQNILKTRGCDGGRIFESYTSSEDTKTKYFLGMFLNMIIYACHNADNEKEWNQKGTDLMIIYMNLFILNYE